MASLLFAEVARHVLTKGEEATLERNVIVALQTKCNIDQRVRAVFDAILRLFGDDETTIPILDNKKLNKHMLSFADIITSYLSTVNITVSKEIASVFD